MADHIITTVTPDDLAQAIAALRNELDAIIAQAIAPLSEAVAAIPEPMIIEEGNEPWRGHLNEATAELHSTLATLTGKLEALADRVTELAAPLPTPTLPDPPPQPDPSPVRELVADADARPAVETLQSPVREITRI